MTEKVLITGGSSITKLIVAALTKEGIEYKFAPSLADSELSSSCIQEPNRKKSKRRTYNLREVQ